jgi:hypothetical protein
MANVLIQPVSGAIQFNEQTAGGTTVPDLSSNGIQLSQVDSSGLQVESHFGGLTGGTRFSVQGEGGQLLGVTDALTGDVFSVNDASGLPIINVNSCFIDVVKIGTHGTNALVVSGGNVGIGTSQPSQQKLTVAGGVSAIGLSAMAANKGFVSAGRDLADIFATSSGSIDGSGTTCYIANFSDSNTIQSSPGYFDSNELRIVSLSASAGLCTAGIRAIGNNLTTTGNISAIGSLSASSACIGGDLKWTGGATNAGNGNLIMGTGNLMFADTGRVRIGDSNDLELYHDATNSRIENGDGELLIIQNANGEDMCFYGDDGSGNIATYFHLDGGSVCTIFSKNTQHTDGVIAQFGTGSDLLIQHDGNNSYIYANGTGDLRIEQYTDNKDICLSTDDGYGNTVAYVCLDGSAEQILLSGTGLPASAGEVGIGTANLQNLNYMLQVVI